jgi:hypothetical protein
MVSPSRGLAWRGSPFVLVAGRWRGWSAPVVASHGGLLPSWCGGACGRSRSWPPIAHASLLLRPPRCLHKTYVRMEDAMCREYRDTCNHKEFYGRVL